MTWQLEPATYHHPPPSATPSPTARRRLLRLTFSPIPSEPHAEWHWSARWADPLCRRRRLSKSVRLHLRAILRRNSANTLLVALRIRPVNETDLQRAPALRGLPQEILHV